MDAKKSRVKMKGDKPPTGLKSLGSVRSPLIKAVDAASIISVADKRGIITYVNQNFVRISGYSRAKLLGNNHNIINSGHHPKSFWVHVWKTIASGKPWRGEVKNKAKDGSFYWVDTFIMPVADSKGKIKEYISIRNDITARKLLELEAIESEKKLSKAQQVASLGNWEMLGNFSDTYWSDEFYRMHGLELASVKPSTSRRLAMVHHRDRAKLQQAIDGAWKDGKAFSIENRIIRPDGSVRWVQSKGETSIDEKTGKRKVFGTLLEITERKMAEQRAHEIEREVVRLALIAKETDNLVVITDVHRKIEWVNKAFEDLTEYSLAEVKGRNPREFLQGTEPDAELNDRVRQLLNDQQSTRFEIVNFSKSGTPYWLDIEIKPIFNSKGELVNFIAIESNITERKESQARLATQANELFHKNEQLTSLAENIPDGAIYQVLINASHKHVFVYFSLGVEKITGLKLNDILKDPTILYSRNFADDVDSFQKKEEEAITNLTVFDAEFRFWRADGQLIWLHTHSKPRQTPEGVLFDGLMTDVTERKQTEEKLKEVEDRIISITKNIPHGAIYQFAYKPGGNFFIPYISETILEIIGIPASEVVSDVNRLLKLIHSQDAMDFNVAVSHSATTLEDFNHITRFRMPDNSYRWISVRAKPRVLDDGTILWDGVLFDETNRKLLEDRLQFTRFTIDHSSDAVFWLRPDGSFYDFNPAACASLGYTAEEFSKLTVPDLDPNYNHDVWPHHWNELREKKTMTFPSQQRRKDGSLLEVEVNANFIEFEGQEYNCAFVRDISERNSIQEKLIGSEQRFRKLIYDINIGVLLQGPQAEILLSNQSALELLDLTEDQLLGRSSFSPEWNVVREDGSKFSSEFHPVPQAIALKRPIRNVVMGVYRPTRKNYVWLSVDALPRLNAKGEVTDVICTFNDITHRKESEKILRESEDRYRRLFDLNPVPTWIYDMNDFKFLQVNKAAVAHYGFSAEEFLGKSILDIRPEEEREHLKKVTEGLSKRNEGLYSHANYWKHTKKDGSIIDVDILSTGFDYENRQARLVTVQDVTERLQAERKLIEALRDKDMLIKEIHHRVKNNLQLISSILSLKMMGLEQSEVKIFLDETRQKIHSIALIHERLLQTDSVNKVDIADYLGKLLRDLELTNKQQDLNLTVSSSIESEMMDLDMAINCGLIINEAVTNSIKHAFTGRTLGHIEVTLRKVDNEFELQIGNDGQSMPANVAPGHSNSFGMHLLDIFIKQMNGKVEIDRANGTRYTIRFK